MARTRRWLVGLDRSELGFLALTEALHVASERGGEVHALFVWQPLGDATNLYAGPADPALEYELDRLAPLVRAHVEGFAERTGGAPSVILHGVVGPAAEALVTVAAALDADAIFIGTHGRTGLKRLVLGSVAEEVVRKAGCPVHVARERVHEVDARWPTHHFERSIRGSVTAPIADVVQGPGSRV